MTLFLTPDEIETLTEYKQPARQIRWLTRNGYRFDVSARGRPKVLRSALDSGKGKKSGGPNLDAIT